MDRQFRILVIDDEETMLRIISRSLEQDNYIVETFRTGTDAISRLHNGDVDIVITDLMLPDRDGFDVIKETHAIDENIPVVVITAYSSIESAVKAIKSGAYDFIPKPFDPEHISIVVKRAVETRNLKLENIGLKMKLKDLPDSSEIIGTSHAMQQVFDMIEKVKNTDGTVLLIGESGVGKELVARAIHYKSKRSEKPFIAINCGALPDELLESELFGYEKGAFTGAINRKIGLFEAANGGTVFLDEVSSISQMMQVKLLRFLQERSFMRLGGKETISVDVRIIAATNEYLRDAVNKGVFRKDLYYRLNVIPIEIPPLRERREDIPLLIRHFIRKFSLKISKDIKGIDRQAEELLKNYKWEGNVRELENVIERAITITNDAFIGVNDMPDEIKNNKGSLLLEETADYPTTLSLFDIERIHISKVLKSVNNNKSKAARILGIDYSTLLRKLKSMEIDI
ncbi:acetoacetate metabolism regulatory protein AtoC [Dissulfurispira thermophila]|uniref:Acetoacetate metabolism regulatory protein AtoC n=1 Tax=Dissulfurispira thermophila TaxID=2715679 RepID=A0A7G1H288_9BACT|nr:sigma-54 dependent transcriptional regulator [Dissulfurispira thermophila]BCB96241.1 acetoacetate metabolism regulatory protein AtoC [Dissulfurispira thermophila]